MKIEERKKNFVEKLRPFIDEYGREMLNTFYLYWTEMNEGGKKMRYEKEKVFEIKKRLARWKLNSARYCKKEKKNTVSEYLKAAEEGKRLIEEKYKDE